MRKIFFSIVFLSATSALFAAGTNDFSSEKERVSYALGLNWGTNLKQAGVEVDAQAIVRGINDGQTGKSEMTIEEARAIITNYRNELVSQEALTNKLEGEAFLAANAKKPGVVTLPDGLQYKIITDGKGPTPTPDDIVAVNYSGTFVNGKVFDQSRPGQPAKISLQRVIPGWAEGLTKMKVGSKWQLFIPANLAYGENGPPGMPPDSVLIFEVELLAIGTPAPPAGLTSDIIKVPSAAEMAKGAKIETIKPGDVSKSQGQGTNN